MQGDAHDGREGEVAGTEHGTSGAAGGGKNFGDSRLDAGLEVRSGLHQSPGVTGHGREVARLQGLFASEPALL